MVYGYRTANDYWFDKLKTDLDDMHHYLAGLINYTINFDFKPYDYDLSKNIQYNLNSDQVNVKKNCFNFSN